MAGGFLYFYRTYTVTASGSRTRREQCVGCGCAFRYEITREVAGGGHSAFYLNNAGAAASAQRRARENLNHALDTDVEPVHCPACGIYQSDMVRVLRERYGKRCGEPNKYAAERIAVTMEDAWRAAYAANTIESFTKFAEVWPAYRWYAERQLREKRYPPHLRKLVSRLGWIAWAALILFIIAIATGMFR